jgi:hypothetical protein
MMIALLAIGHIYVTLGKLLFLLPASESSCTISSVRYSPPSGKWERGSYPPSNTCEFEQFVEPGALVPVWGDASDDSPQELEVFYQLGTKGKERTVKLKPEPLTPESAARLAASARKEKGSVRLEVKNEGEAPVLVGDAIAARNKPKDACEGNGPTVAIPPGETLVDIRPGLLSPSMKAWVALFSAEKSCRWHEVALSR